MHQRSFKPFALLQRITKFKSDSMQSKIPVVPYSPWKVCFPAEACMYNVMLNTTVNTVIEKTNPINCPHKKANFQFCDGVPKTFHDFSTLDSLTNINQWQMVSSFYTVNSVPARYTNATQLKVIIIIYIYNFMVLLSILYIYIYIIPQSRNQHHKVIMYIYIYASKLYRNENST